MIIAIRNNALNSSSVKKYIFMLSFRIFIKKKKSVKKKYPQKYVFFVHVLRVLRGWCGSKDNDHNAG